MKKIINLVLFLGILSAIAGGALAYVNSLTAPVIEQNAIAAETATLQEIFPGAEFTEVDFADETGIVETVYLADNGGYAFKCSNVGFNTSTPINFIVGLDADGTTVGYQIVSQQETSGIGDVIIKDAFIENVLGRGVDEDIDLVSGATFSSTAIQEGIRAAKDVFKNLPSAALENNTLMVSGEVNYE